MATVQGLMLDLHGQVADLLGHLDQRYTAGRRALVDALSASGRPMSIPELLAAIPGVPQSSAYRHLAVLAEAGAVERIAGGDDFGRFELAESLTGHHHHHLACTTCGSVADIDMSAAFERAVAKAAAEVLERVGFAVTAHDVVLSGSCASCSAAAARLKR